MQRISDLIVSFFLVVRDCRQGKSQHMPNYSRIHRSETQDTVTACMREQALGTRSPTAIYNHPLFVPLRKAVRENRERATHDYIRPHLNAKDWGKFCRNEARP